MNKQTKLLLLVGGLLVLVGFLKPDLSRIIPSPNNPAVVVDTVDIDPPSDASLRDKAATVAESLKNGPSSRKVDAKRLRDLYMDLSTLVSLDGEQEVIKNTEEIRQANALTGVMLRLDLKGKYDNLASACNDVLVTGIGDDNINLTPELRIKAIDAFRALAWACNEGSK